MQSALRIVETILDDLRPGPEPVNAMDPALGRVEWDLSRGDSGIPGERADKMLIVAGAVRTRAAQNGLLHQLPQLLLVADDGATAELLGRYGIGRTGMLVSRTDLDGDPVGPAAQESGAGQ